MPAINAAANPVSAVASPPTPNSGSSAASSDERPFATVLAEQTGKPPKGTEKEQKAGSATAAPSSSDGETEPAAPVTTAPVVPDGQSLMAPIIVAPVLPPGESGTDEAIVDAQIQTAAELIQAVLMPAGTAHGSARPDAAAIRQAQSAAAMDAAPAAAQVPGLGVEMQGEPVADMLLAVARNAHSETPPEGGGMPAKLAAPREVFALPADRDAVQLTDALAARSAVGMAPAAEAMVAAVPMHAAAASLQARHGTEYQIVTPVGSQHWETAVGNSLVIMSGARQDRAELVLTPPQLGRIEVSISVKGDEATAIFVSANPAVREALESALPRLREVLAEAGIALGQTHVGAESQGQSAGERQNGDNASRPGIVDATGNSESPLGLGGPNNATHRVISRSLVDTYA